MQHFHLLLGLGALVLLAALLSARRRLSRRYRFPYRLVAPALLTPAQRGFRALVEQALGADYRLHCRIRVADVIGIDRRAARRERERAEDRLGEQAFDLLVCDAETDAIVAAILLLPRPRLRRAGPPRHRLEPVCAAAGLPLVCFREGETGAPEAVAERILGAVNARSGPARAGDEPAPDEIHSMLQKLSHEIRGDRRPRTPPELASAPPRRAREPRLGDPDRID